MSTQDIPDKELDDFFKKSLEEPHIAFEEEAWAKMEQKMEKVSMQQAFIRRLLYSLLLLSGLFTGILSLYLLDQKTPVTLTPNHPDNLAEQRMKYTEKDTPEGNLQSLTTDTKNEQEPDGKMSIDNDNIRKQVPAPSGIMRAPQPENTIPHSQNINKRAVNLQPDKNKPTTITPSFPEKNIVLYPAEKEAKSREPEKEQFFRKQGKNHLTTFDGNTITPTVQKKKTNLQALEQAEETDFSGPASKRYGRVNKPDTTTTLLSGKEQSFTLKEEQVTTHKVIEPLSSLLMRLHEGYDWDNRSPLVSGILPPGLVNNVVLPEDTSIHEKLAKPRFNPGFRIGIALSPDMSSVGFSNWTIPGTNAGLIVEYNISRRWSFSTGAVYSTKIYKAEGKDYTPPKDFWGTYKIWPEKVDATCKVLDIPLNVRYNMVNGKKFTFFASTGMSSYLMLKENYQYKYGHYVNDKYLRKSYSTENEFKHFFSVVNFSAGYERKLNNRLSLQAEPFLKLPLAGVGFGKIKLLSTGAFLSLKYKL